MTIPMRRGARDPQTATPSVRDVQTALKTKLNVPLVADGIFGTKTTQAVRSFQAKNILPISGIVDIATWRLLSASLVVPKPTPMPAPPKTGVRLGSWVYGMTSSPSKLTAMETLLERKLSVASYFYGYGDWFPVQIEKNFAANGTRDVLLSWDMGPYRYSTWSAGKHNAYLDNLVSCAKSYPYTVYVRPWPEMNGDWQEFQPDATGSTVYGGTYSEFIAAWRYVVTYFRSRGVNNIKWVFNPTTDVYSGTTDVRNIWPGTEFVDVLGLDGYNWGNGGPFTWQEFKTIYSVQYARLTALHPTAPVWVCETGCKEPLINDGSPIDITHSKADWISNMFKDIPTYFSRITTVCWFNEKKERDWRLESSVASLATAKAIL